MDSHELQTYIQEQVPITQSMGLEVKSIAADHLELQFPKAPNKNHLNTAFGGSLLGAAALSCWAWVSTRLKTEGFSEAHVVLQRCQSEFLGPVEEDFTARCEQPSPENWEDFTLALRKKGKSRLQLEAKIYQNGVLKLNYSGDYVALVSK